MSRSVKFYLYSFIAVGIVSALFHSLGIIQAAPWSLVYSDVFGFYQKAVAPGFPYLTKLIEYPVLTGLFIQLMGWLGKTAVGYYNWSSFFLIALGSAATYFLFQMAKDKKKIFQYWI